MRGQVRFVLILALVVSSLVAMNVDAQETASCSGLYLEPFAGDSEYNTACEAFNACVERVDDFVKCAPDFLAARLAVCQPNSAICIAQAQLQTALIGMYQSNGYQAQTQTPEFWADLTSTLLDADTVEGAASSGAAQEWFAPLVSDYTDHPMLNYVFGVLAELNGDADAAQAEYEAALAQNSDDPLIYLALGDLYAARDMTTLASVAYALVAPSAGEAGLPEDIAARLAALPDALKVELPASDEDALFPVLLSSGGPGGGAAFDLSLDVPTPVNLAKIGETLLLIIPEDLQRAENDYRLILPFYPLKPDGFGNFTWNGEDYYNGFWTSIVLTPDETTAGAYKGRRSDTVFEGTRSLDFYITPAGQGDPRPKGFRCEGAPQTRLADAIFALPYSFFEPVVLYDAPGGAVAAEIEQDSQLIIGIDEGPECADGFTWYHATVSIEGAETTGWIRENTDATRYNYFEMFYD